MNLTKKILIISIIFFLLLGTVILFRQNQTKKASPSLSPAQKTQTTSSAVPSSFAFPSPPSVNVVTFSKEPVLPTELSIFAVDTTSTASADTNISTLASSLHLSTPSSMIKNKDAYTYAWNSDVASVSYFRNGVIETLSYQNTKGGAGSSSSASLEGVAISFLLKIAPSLPDKISWKKLSEQTKGFEGIILPVSSLTLRAFVYGLELNNTYPILFPGQTEEIARVVVDNNGVVRSYSGFLINFTIKESGTTPLISWVDLQKKISQKEAPIITISGKEFSPDASPPTFSSVVIDSIRSAYLLDERSLRLLPYFLVSGETNEKGVRITYLLPASAQ